MSKYTGIRFYAKASGYTSIAVNVNDQNFDNAFVNKWKSVVSVGKEWKEYIVPFDELVLAKNHARNNPGGDGTFDLDNIENIVIGIGGKANIKNENITFWLDEISLY